MTLIEGIVAFALLAIVIVVTGIWKNASSDMVRSQFAHLRTLQRNIKGDYKTSDRDEKDAAEDR